MTEKTPLATAITTIGWTPPEAARRLGCSEEYIRKMMAGTNPTPLGIFASLDLLVKMHARWKPLKWRKRG